MPPASDNPPPPQYKVIGDQKWHKPVYSGPSRVAAARIARKEAAKRGRPMLLTGPEGFRTRRYLPEMSGNKRWWYVEECPQCQGPMHPDSRTQRCRRCWDPRESEAHMAAVAALNKTG